MPGAPGFPVGENTTGLVTDIGLLPGNTGFGWFKTASATLVGAPGLVIPNCVGYYEADLVTGVANGGTLTAWNDAGPTTNHLNAGTFCTMASGSGAVAGFAGLPSLTFNGTNMTINASAYAAALVQPLTLVAVCQPSSVTGPKYAVGGVTGGTSNAVGCDNSLWAGNAGSLVDSNATATANKTVIAIGSFSGATSFLRINGVQTPAISVGTQNLAQLNVGALAGANFFAGQIAMIGVWPRALQAGEMLWLETFYRAKYQIF